MLLHILEIHLRYNSWPKSEKSTKKKLVEEKNQGGEKEISSNLGQNSPIIWTKIQTKPVSDPC